RLRLAPVRDVAGDRRSEKSGLGPDGTRSLRGRCLRAETGPINPELGGEEANAAARLRGTGLPAHDRDESRTDGIESPCPHCPDERSPGAGAGGGPGSSAAARFRQRRTRGPRRAEPRPRRARWSGTRLRPAPLPRADRPCAEADPARFRGDIPRPPAPAREARRPREGGGSSRGLAPVPAAGPRGLPAANGPLGASPARVPPLDRRRVRAADRAASVTVPPRPAAALGGVQQGHTTGGPVPSQRGWKPGPRAPRAERPQRAR